MGGTDTPKYEFQPSAVDSIPFFDIVTGRNMRLAGSSSSAGGWIYYQERGLSKDKTQSGTTVAKGTRWCPLRRATSMDMLLIVESFWETFRSINPSVVLPYAGAEVPF